MQDLQESRRAIREAAGIAKGRITAEEVLAISEREKPRFSALVGGTAAEIARA